MKIQLEEKFVIFFRSEFIEVSLLLLVYEVILDVCVAHKSVWKSFYPSFNVACIEILGESFEFMKQLSLHKK